MSTTTTLDTVDTAFGDSTVAQFIATQERDRGLEQLVAEHCRLEEAIAALFRRRSQIPARIREIDLELVDAADALRSELLHERAVLAAELESLEGQARSATARSVEFLMAALEWIHRLASSERQAAEAEYDERHPRPEFTRSDGYDELRYHEKRTSALRKACELQDAVIARTVVLARDRHPGLSDLSPGDRRTWADAVRVAIDRADQRLKSAA